MNLPNKLTIGRLALTAAFVAAMSWKTPWADIVALIIFVAASVTDYYDGKIARERNLITDFGKLMDPLADKILISAAFVLLCERGLIAAWIVVAIISREFLVTGMRLIASANGSVLAADSLGKLKTVFQIVTVVYFLLLLATTEQNAWAARIGVASSLLAGALTIASGVSYGIKNRSIIQTE